MKIFFISDIHGNEFALESILKYANAIESDLIFCAGDISGYFINTNRVVSLLRAYNVQSILGNHDAFLLDLLPINPKKSYYPAFERTRRELSDESYEWLEKLPTTLEFSIDKLRLKIYHGGPDDNLNQYVYPHTLYSNLPQYKYPGIIVFGHTHLQFVYKYEDKVYINPGSVGLPRNGDYRAHGISYDSATNLFIEHKIMYDINGLIEKYFQEPSVNFKFFHNVNFGRSSNKILKIREGSFLDAASVNTLKELGIITINTRFGAILSFCANDSSDSLLYIASYSDDTVELTSNTLFFHSINNVKDAITKFSGDKRFISDKAGFYFFQKFLGEAKFKSNLINNILTAIRFIKNKQ